MTPDRSYARMEKWSRWTNFPKPIDAQQDLREDGKLGNVTEFPKSEKKQQGRDAIEIPPPHRANQQIDTLSGQCWLVGIAPSILPPAPAESVLAEWTEEGVRREPSHSNVVTFISPSETYALTVEVDDPIRGYLIRLLLLNNEETRIGQTVVEDRDDALTVAANMVAAADDLATLEDRPILGPETVHHEDIEREATQPPEE